MSDYVANLVLRTLSPERCVQPLLPSVFEPLPTRVGLDDGPRFQPAIHYSSDVQDEVPARFSAPPESQLTRETSTGSSHLVSPKSLAAFERPKFENGRFSGEENPVWALPAEATGRVQARSVPDLSLSLPMSPILEQASADFIGRTLSNGLVQPLVTAKGLGTPMSGPPPLTALPSKDSDNDTSRQPVAMPLLPAEKARASPMVRPASNATPTSGPKSMPDNNVATGTINVTIGRVEVRASVISASPRPKSASAPVMNLDEYMRQRASEGAG